MALRAADPPAGWSVQANPVPDGGLSDNPSLAGIRGFSFTSGAHGWQSPPVVGIDGNGAAQMTSESIPYYGPDAATSAVQELVQAFSGCPADRYAVQRPDARSPPDSPRCLPRRSGSEAAHCRA